MQANNIEVKLLYKSYMEDKVLGEELKSSWISFRNTSSSLCLKIIFEVLAQLALELISQAIFILSVKKWG